MIVVRILIECGAGMAAQKIFGETELPYGHTVWKTGNCSHTHRARRGCDSPEQVRFQATGLLRLISDNTPRVTVFITVLRYCPYVIAGPSAGSKYTDRSTNEQTKMGPIFSPSISLLRLRKISRACLQCAIFVI
jgi:hypothetical protein